MTIKSKKLSLDNTCPRFGKPDVGRTYAYELEPDPYKFLDRFQSHCHSAWGDEFIKHSLRLLLLAIKDDTARRSLESSIKRQANLVISQWEDCQTLFIDSVLSPQERHDSVALVAKEGLKKGEHYRDFADRMLGLIKVYKIDDGNHTVLSSLRSSIPSMTINLIKTMIFSQDPQKGFPALTSLSVFLSTLREIEGPDSAIKRARTEDDHDSESSTSLKRHRNSKKKSSSSASIKTVSDGKKYTCDKCGPNNTHDTTKCLKDVICNACNKTGHIA
ncbi:hypothetical protein FBU30_003100, partial [Linnemannia zychae]